YSNSLFPYLTSLKIASVQQEIDPDYYEGRDDYDAHEYFRSFRVKTDSQARPARCERRKRVEIKRCQAAECCEHEWIPFQCRQKVTVKKLNPTPRHTARDAREARDVVKHAARPWQTNC